MLESKSFEDQVKDLYHFFVDAELNNKEITYEQIQERLIDRTYDTLVWYANNFWTWFLSKKKEKRGRYRVFVCHGLSRYPEHFFLEAHRKSQGKYFYHFGRALDDSRERARIRKQMREQAGLPQPDLPEPPIGVEQEFPEELHFADNETEEMEEREIPEPLAHTSTAALPRELAPFQVPTQAAEKPALNTPLGDQRTRDAFPADARPFHGASTVSENLTMKERIIEMLDFFRNNRAALDQLNRTVTVLVQEQNQFRSEISSELQSLKQTLDAHIQQTSSTHSQFDTSVVDQVHAAQQIFSQEQERLREVFVGKVETLTQELQRSHTSPDDSSIHIDLTDHIDRVEQTLATITNQLSSLPDLESLRALLESDSEHVLETLLPKIEHSLDRSELQGIANSMSKVQQHISGLSLEIGKLSQSSSDMLNGHTRPLQASIQEASSQARQAITALEKAYSAWIEELQQHLQITRQSYAQMGGHLQTVHTYILPDREQPQDMAVVQEKEAAHDQLDQD